MDLVISINKPKDISSHDAVSKVKRILKVKKAGHTGTLDPMATGLMLICTNRATRLAPYLSGLSKEYRAVMKLGEVTDTQDARGRITEKTDIMDLNRSTVEEAVMSFRGRIRQQPPMYSAIKHKGKPLYKLARKGIEVERKIREVAIHHIEVTDINLPYVSFTAGCSKGTYIRTLCHDIGQKLGIGAHLAELERTAVNGFRVSESLTFEELQSSAEGAHTDKGMYTMDEALPWMPEFTILESQTKAVLNGNPLKLNGLKVSDNIRKADGIRVKSPANDLLAIGSYSAVKNIIKLDVVFV
jgi:tRNA pseudouridine55 synthase